ncbi:sulfotransferase [Nocardioides sp. TF02-7]|uniref:sulfotransferase family protein n=1 Tax=Nocardioides sp. TF02-7 TaxID=2917724 RepID=UPI001F07036B|nr:sulfotransferase [Nocardioides sp. TF02-7]UMG91275.1 sulfotransferase [Nocardioides sp. TF02-7]
MTTAVRDEALDAEALLDEARRRTGLTDFGDPTLPARFGTAVALLTAEGLDADGRQAAREVCLRLLTNRLRFFADRARHPIADEQVVRPLFATGEPRSGTTLLHALLARDPAGRAPRFWELMHPSPPPGLAAPDDPRRAEADEEWRAILRRIPTWLVNHPYNDMLGDGLAECERLWDFDFRRMGPTTWWRVPIRMKMSELPADPRAEYALHRKVLQHCQFARPPRHWVLKGFHSTRLDALFATYPDAHVVWTHRDPVQVIASRIVMAGQLDEGMHGSVDWADTARRYLALSRESIRAALASPYLDDPRVHHVRYSDFVADPVGVIGRFYDAAGRRMTAEHEAAIGSYLRDNRGDRHGKFRYSTDVIGEDVAALNEEFAPYRERFGVEIEQRD